MKKNKLWLLPITALFFFAIISCEEKQKEKEKIVSAPNGIITNLAEYHRF